MGDMIYNVSKNIGIFINGEYKNLDGLKKSWKDQIVADSFGKDLISSTKVDKDVIKWLRTEAKKTAGGGEVCCYCGLVCPQESYRGNFRAHMKKHLYRMKECKRCNAKYNPHLVHSCTKPVRYTSVRCTECGKILSSSSN